jgi:hypothetical protein
MLNPYLHRGVQTPNTHKIPMMLQHIRWAVPSSATTPSHHTNQVTRSLAISWELSVLVPAIELHVFLIQNYSYIQILLLVLYQKQLKRVIQSILDPMVDIVFLFEFPAYLPFPIE